MAAVYNLADRGNCGVGLSINRMMMLMLMMLGVYLVACVSYLWSTDVFTTI